MSWRKLAPASGSPDDWVRLCADARFRIEPYLVWHNLSGFRFSRGGVRDWLPVLLQTTVGAKQLELRVQALGLGDYKDIIRIPSAYKRGLAPGKRSARFLTASIAADKLATIARMPEVLRMQLGLARVGDVDVAAPPPYRFLYEMAIPPDYSESEYLLQPGPYDVDRPVLGVIDDGCNFAHPSYVLGRNSRVVRLWDQSAEAPQWSGKPMFFGYGGVLAEREIKGLLASGRTERDTYSLIYEGKTYPSLIKTKGTHGTSVMQLLAGDYQPFPQQPPAPPADAARGADVMFVQLPNTTLDDTSSSALCVAALDAIRYIVDRAETYRRLQENGRPGGRVMRKVVINLSYGNMSGPHDGTALLDLAIDELVQKRGDLAVVVAAGNSRKPRCHASLCLDPGEEGEVGLFTAPLNPLPSTVEIWFPAANRDIAVGLTDPAGNTSGWVSRGEAHALRQGNRDVAWLLYPKASSLGGSGRMALLAIAPTFLEKGGSHEAPHGLWTISVRNRGRQRAEVDAWVDRNDMAYARVRRQQTRLEDLGSRVVTSAGTMCSPATASCAVAVGARVWSTGCMSDYSAQGHHRGKQTTDADADVDRGGNVRGLRVPATASGATVRMSGTSAAAPIVARRIAHWMAARSQVSTCEDIRDFLASTSPGPVDEAGTLP